MIVDLPPWLVVQVNWGSNRDCGWVEFTSHTIWAKVSAFFNRSFTRKHVFFLEDITRTSTNKRQLRTNKTETGSILDHRWTVWSYRQLSSCRVPDRNRNWIMVVWFHQKVENSVLLEFVNKCLRAVALIWMSVLSLLSLSWYKFAGKAFLRQTLKADFIDQIKW